MNKTVRRTQTKRNRNLKKRNTRKHVHFCSKCKRKFGSKVMRGG